MLPDDDDGLDDVLAGRTGNSGGKQKGQANKRRMAKDKKYGFGGPKRKLKQADSKSLNDFSSFNPKKGKVFGGGKKKGGGAKKGKNRPGKTTRAKMRTKRR